MKICHIMDSGGFYGKERVVMELTAKQVDEGHYVQVICLGDKIPALAEKAMEIGIGRTHIWFMGFKAGFRWKDMKALKRVLNLISFDVVHVHGQKESIYAVLARWGIPLVRTVHGYTSNKKFSKAWFKNILDRLLFSRHDAVVGVSDDMKKKYGVDQIIKNGISCREFKIDSLNEKVVDFCKSAKVVLGCTARYSPEKNLQNLILAMTLLPEDYKLLLLGNGPLLPEIDRLIIDHRLETRIKQAGFVSNAFDYLSLVDIYLQPSYTEGTPISVLEAMCAGKNIIMTEVGGMKYLLDEDVGRKCDTDPQSIATAITLGLVDEEFKTHISRPNRAKAVFNKEYSIDSMCAKYLDLYTSFLIKPI